MSSKVPMPSKEEVLDTYTKLKSLLKCSKVYNVSDETFRKWLKHYKIERYPQGLNRITKEKRFRVNFK